MIWGYHYFRKHPYVFFAKKINDICQVGIYSSKKSSEPPNSCGGKWPRMPPLCRKLDHPNPWVLLNAKGLPLVLGDLLEVSCVTVLKTKEITGHAKRCVFCEGKLVLWQESGGYKPPIFTRICSFPTTNIDQTYTCWCLKILKGSPTILCNNLDPLLGGSFEDNRCTAAAYNGSWKWPDFQAWTTADKLRLMHDWFERDHRISLAEDCSCTYTIEWPGIHKRESTTKQYFYVLLMQKHILTDTHTHTFNTSPKCKSDVPKYLDRRQLIHQI